MEIPPEFTYQASDFSGLASPPTTAISDAPTRLLCINAEWATFIIGVVSRLAEFDVWLGDFDTRADAISSINAIQLQLATEADCMAPRLRQNPFDDCKLQASYDSGQSWVDVFDFSLCLSPNTSSASLTFDMDWRVDIIRAYYAQGGIATVAPDIVYDATAADADRDEAMCFALNRFVDAIAETELQRREGEEQNLQNLIQAAIQAMIVIGGLLSAGTLSTIILLLMGAIVKAGYTVFAPLTNQELGDHTARRELACCLYTEMQGQTISLVGLQAAADTCAGSGSGGAQPSQKIVSAIDDYTDTILVLATAMDEAFSLQRLGVLPGCDCNEWTHDFLMGDGDSEFWVIEPYDNPASNECEGTYNGGGDRFDGCNAGTGFSHAILIRADIPTTLITHIEFVGSGVATRATVNDGHFIRLDGMEKTHDDYGTVWTNELTQWDGNQSVSTIQLQCAAGLNGLAGSPDSRITRISITGRGVDPFS
jgi:hypothetical protein